MGDTPVGRTWDRCVLLTTDLRHHSNNRRAMMMFQTVGHGITYKRPMNLLVVGWGKVYLGELQGGGDI